MMERICERTARVIALAFDGKQKHIERAFQQHQAIFQAIISGDAASAEKQVFTHIDSTKNILNY
jgi:DNA-binding FadR family transcriptional regulator